MIRRNAPTMVKPATYRKRATALMVDSLVALSIVMILMAILNSVIPDTEVAPMAMQLMPPKMLKMFFYTTTTITLFIGLMVFFAPHLPGRGSLGHRVAKIQLVQLSGENVGWVDSLRRFFATVLRAGMVFWGGPVLAVVGQSIAVSTLALIWSLVVLLPIPVRRKPYPVTLWQIVGNYIFIDSSTS
ncbi:MAG: RDD family protein [Deltaproteobacteria bacterium]|jgi:hypothetical protein|nr:RDD family protein [Deltaproteobacteria bacterium]